MILFLKLIGAFLVAFFLFAVALYLLVRRAVRVQARILRDGQDMGVGSQFVQPMRIFLESIERVDSWDEAAVDALAQPLLDRGFTDVGAFEAEVGGGRLALWALADSKRAIYATIHEVGPASLGLDLVTHYTDGRSVTYSNVSPREIEFPPGKSIEFCEDLSAAELLERFLRERPNAKTTPVSRVGFVETFEQCYAEEMEWRARQGGPSEEEIRRVVAAEGLQVTDETIEQVQEMWSDRHCDLLDGELRTNFLEKTKLTALQWEEIRDRFTLVHDKLSPETVADLCDEGDEEEDEDAWVDRHQERQQLARAKGARAAFAQWNRTALSEDRYQKIGRVHNPIDTDVYLAPESYDEYDD